MYPPFRCLSFAVPHIHPLNSGLVASNPTNKLKLPALTHTKAPTKTYPKVSVETYIHIVSI